MRIILVLAASVLAALNSGCARDAGNRDSMDGIGTPMDEGNETMNKALELTDLSGQWSGETSLWFMPGDPARESTTHATVTSAALGKVLLITYNWDYEGDPQEGTLTIRTQPHAKDVEVVWYDTWHSGGKFMSFHGEEERDGFVNVRCSYSAPPGPDWGWRIQLDAADADAFHILMHNISPDGEETLAVDSRYTRVGAAQ